MSKKNNKQRSLKRHQDNLARDEVRAKRIEAKIKEVSERPAPPENPEDDWEDVAEDADDRMDAENGGAESGIKNELPSKKIKKDKVKFKIFQKRILIQERKRMRKAKKSGYVVYKKAMNVE
jgi:hypothetical protein